MKCPQCNKDVPAGFLFCPHCLAEIPWVKEYDTVETRLEKKKLEEKENTPAPEEEVLPDTPPVHEHESFLKWLFSGKRLIFLWLATAGILLILVYIQTHTFDAYFRRAVVAVETEDYEKALGYIESALEKDPENLQGNLLLARILELEGKPDDAVLVYKPLLSQYPGNADLYLETCRLLAIQERYDEISALLGECDDERILTLCSSYISEPPWTSLKEGTYAGWVPVELRGNGGKIYYTLDGEEPTIESSLYEGPIILKEGKTVLKAMQVNSQNVPSEAATWTYVVSADVPSPPDVSPESGFYYEETRIEIKVPDGCKAYYAFDGMPSEEGTEYTAPILMPTGAHVFYAILLSASGNKSELTIRDYYLEY